MSAATGTGATAALAALGRYEEAAAALEALPADRRSAADCHLLGDCYRALGRADEAIAAYQAAVGADPAYAPAFTAAGDLFAAHGMALQAFDCYGCALGLSPDDADVRGRFLNYARGCRFETFNPPLKALLMLCLEAEGGDFSLMGEAWHSLLRADPVFGTVYRALAAAPDFAAFEAAFAGCDEGALREPVFLAALRKPVRVPSMEYETVVTRLRRLFLRRHKGGVAVAEDVAAAFAHYCHHTEYVFAVTEEEAEALPALTGAAARGDAGALCLLACYRPLDTVPEVRGRAEKLADKALYDLQIGQPEELRAIAASFPPRHFETGVSEKVRGQYEESPYPRWTACARQMYSPAIEGALAGTGARILVAGCGTGREAVELALVFPDATVTGIDLSRASLSYATMQARRCGAGNAAFRQEDIMDLPPDFGPFDYIASTGVLHHMQDPEGGWDVLTRLLAPGGIMRICLYSAPSRGAIRAAQKEIAARGYDDSADAIRRFRGECGGFLSEGNYKKITSYIDFYSLSECRDLLFHVYEQDFTIGRIRAYLDKAGLEFLGFNVDADILARYVAKNPQDPQGRDLERWERFEKKSPEIFTGMYRLWLRRTAG